MATERHLAIADMVNRIAEEIGRSLAQVAIAWTLMQSGVTSTLLGVSTSDQLLANLAALTVELSPEQLQELDQISAIERGFPHDFLAQVRHQPLMVLLLSFDILHGIKERVWVRRRARRDGGFNCRW